MRVATVRLTKELALLQKSSYNVIPNEKNMLELSCTILGPENGPYQGGKFVVKINATSDYPFKCPSVKFETKIYHPNISSSGEICMKALEETWNSANLISDVLNHIVNVLTNPNVNDPLAADVAFVYKTDQKRYEEIATEWTRDFAK